MNRRGFTLIELLVVISIISLLSSILLASLSTSRQKAKDAAIRSQLKQIASQAELFRATSPDDRYGSCYDVNDCPIIGGAACASGGSMFLSAGMKALIDNIKTISGTNPLCAAVPYPSPSGNATSWAVSATLTDGVTSFCVDSSGQAGDNLQATGNQTAGGGMFGMPPHAAQCQAQLIILP